MHLALLRGINLAGHNAVAMSELRGLVADLGFAEVRTLLQSGNVVFNGGARKPAQLERLLEAEAARRLRLEIDFFVRTAAEWQSVIDRNPFETEATRDPAHLLVVFLKAAPTPAQVKALRGAIVGREVVKSDGRHAYIVFPDGIGRSRLTHTLIEKHLGTRGTGRNWNTIRKMAALAC